MKTQNKSITKINIEKDFFSAYNAQRKKNIDTAVAVVAHYREIPVEEVKTMLRNIIRNLQEGNNLQ
jgi:peptidyl-tRNA hydrolase